MTLKIEPADLSGYENYAVTDERGNHVTIMVRGRLRRWGVNNEPSFTISLKLMGDYGCAEHFWSHAGREGETWWNWLEQTNRSYFLSKLFGSDYLEFDPETSFQEAVRDVLVRRRQGNLTREQAREIYASLNEHEMMDKGAFYNVVGGLTYTEPRPYPFVLRRHMAFEDYAEMGCERIKPRLAQFWDTVWRPFIIQAKTTQGFTLELS